MPVAVLAMQGPLAEGTAKEPLQTGMDTEDHRGEAESEGLSTLLLLPMLSG